MKLEPVAWMTHESSMRLKDGGNCKGAVPVHQQRSHASSIPLYAIPDGYVVVPVEQAKNAERYAWLRDKSFGQYAHPIVIEQRPEGFVPRYLGPLFGDILDSYVDIAIDQTANKAMIAAKEYEGSVIYANGQLIEQTDKASHSITLGGGTFPVIQVTAAKEQS